MDAMSYIATDVPDGMTLRQYRRMIDAQTIAPNWRARIAKALGGKS